MFRSQGNVSLGKSGSTDSGKVSELKVAAFPPLRVVQVFGFGRDKRWPSTTAGVDMMEVTGGIVGRDHRS